MGILPHSPPPPPVLNTNEGIFSAGELESMRVRPLYLLKAATVNEYEITVRLQSYQFVCKWNPSPPTPISRLVKERIVRDMFEVMWFNLAQRHITNWCKNKYFMFRTAKNKSIQFWGQIKSWYNRHINIFICYCFLFTGFMGVRCEISLTCWVCCCLTKIIGFLMVS